MVRRSMPWILLALTACQTTSDAPDDPWHAVRFLAGGWRAESADGIREEIWTPPHAGTMYGQNRTLQDGRLRFFELLTIERRGADLVYVARPRGGDPTEFAMSDSGDRSVTFANPEHDFPKRLRYWLGEGGELRATADDGTDDGERLDFVWMPLR